MQALLAIIVFKDVLHARLDTTAQILLPSTIFNVDTATIHQTTQLSASSARLDMTALPLKCCLRQTTRTIHSVLRDITVKEKLLLQLLAQMGTTVQLEQDT